MRWFGTDWGAPACISADHTGTPLGQRCEWCDEPIQWGDRGFLVPSLGHRGGGPVPYQLECFMRMLHGGVNHQRGLCTCFGGSESPDPPDISMREAAVMAYEEMGKGLPQPDQRCDP